MDEKVFELMEKMYSEMTSKLNGIDNRLGKMDEKLNQMDDRFNRMHDNLLENNRRIINNTDAVRTVCIQLKRLEDDIKPKVETTFSGYHVTNEKHLIHDRELEKINQRIDELTLRVNRHNSKFQVLEGGKKDK